MLHLERFAGLAIQLLLLGALVVVFAPIDNFDYRRVGIWRNFYQVQLPFARNIKRFLPAQYAKLLAIFVDYSQLGCPNLFIQACIFANTLVLLLGELQLSVYFARNPALRCCRIRVLLGCDAWIVTKLH